MEQLSQLIIVLVLSPLHTVYITCHRVKHRAHYITTTTHKHHQSSQQIIVRSNEWGCVCISTINKVELPHWHVKSLTTSRSKDSHIKCWSLPTAWDESKFQIKVTGTHHIMWQCSCWYFLMITDKISKRTENTIVSLHPESIQGIVISHWTEVQRSSG